MSVRHAIYLSDTVGKLFEVSQLVKLGPLDLKCPAGKSQLVSQNVAESGAHLTQLLDLLDKAPFNLSLLIQVRLQLLILLHVCVKSFCDLINL